ncbi:MAG TPA: M20/M25/M40 family metallo-hydrolase [Candidatus Acidoferrum sp.]|nr:M20/M25/M40 family metallo-hydrolase [Candidatus Acidoferrum sp.]
MTSPVAASDVAWDRAHDRLVEDLRDLIRIPTVNPPGDEIKAARHVESLLADAGIPSTVVEPAPGRGSVAAKLHGDGTGGGPLLLLGHLDVVAAPPELWTHDPFAADIADGYIYGRGAVDMKDLVAMELGVLRLLAAQARAAGRDPATDPIPGLKRDVLFVSTADEEAGGRAGAGWIADHHPEWFQADGAINESGGVSTELGGVRFYPIQIAEKGFIDYRFIVHGTWGHGSMPREDNAAVRAARIVERIAKPGPVRMTPTMERFFGLVREAAPSLSRALDALAAGSIREGADCDPGYARVANALLRDTISPNVIQAGLKHNVIPGVATIEVDARTLPGTDEPTMREILRTLIGEELWATMDVEVVVSGEPVVASPDTELYRILAQTLRDHDPEAVPVPIMAPFATDAKYTSTRLGVPTYGFSPLRLEPSERFLDRFHGVDERVSLDALRFGLPVLYDVVRRFCG